MKNSYLKTISIYLLYIITSIKSYKLTILQNSTVVLLCNSGAGAGGGIAVAGWVKPKSTTINYSVDFGTYTGSSLNMFVETNPSFATIHTVKLGA
jgi:hypothetical protein